MPKFKTLDEAYKSCTADGLYRTLGKVDKERIKSLVANAETNIESANTLSKALKEDDRRWMTVYTLHYEGIRILAEALLIFEKVHSINHQGLFAYLCMKMADLELDWNFFEKVRTKRNGTYYYGDQITYKDWKSAEVQMNLYISTLKKEIEKKLKE